MRVFTVISALASGAFCVVLQAQTPEGSRLYEANCAACHGAKGDQVPGIDFQQGQFRRGGNDESLVAIVLSGIPGTAMPPTNLTRGQATAVVAHVRSLRATVLAGGGTGDARRGQALFESQGCYGCHRVSNRGNRTGPELTDAGALRTTAELERSVVDPDASVLPEHRYVRAVARDGSVITGRRLNEDLLTVQLIDTGERLVSLSKPELREYAVQAKSAMPSYKDKLGRQELADLVAFLASLKGGVR